MFNIFIYLIFLVIGEILVIVLYFEYKVYFFRYDINK